MANAVLSGVIVVLALLGVLTIGRALVKHFTQKPALATAEPKPCAHEWEPWSEAKDVGVKQQKRTYEHYSGSTCTECEFVGKFQERVCSTCNIYERRWA